MYVGRNKNADLESETLRAGRGSAGRLVGLVGACLLAVLAAGLTATAARAEGEDEAGGDTRAKIKAKMERILRLMRENEEALLKLSTGSSSATRKVEVDVPPPEGAGNAGAGSSGGESGTESGSTSGTNGSTGGSPSGTGAEVVRGLDEITRGSSGIPDELKQLVEMIPT